MPSAMKKWPVKSYQALIKIYPVIACLSRLLKSTGYHIKASKVFDS